MLLHIALLGSAISNVNRDYNIDENRNTCDVELIAQQVSIKCYLAIFTDVVIFGEFEGGFSE